MSAATIKILHPARFSDCILQVLADLVADEQARLRRPITVLDPFAGTGRVHELGGADVHTVGLEIEPVWAGMHPRTVCADARGMPMADRCVDLVVTSPCYGNRFADSHHARDGSVRRSYTHDLRRTLGDDTYQLRAGSAGAMQFGSAYRDVHQRAWVETVRVLRPGGLLVLNISDHVRGGQIVPVTAWHVDTLTAHGFTTVDQVEIPTRRLRYGANHTARVGHEHVISLRSGQIPDDRRLQLCEAVK